MKRILILCVLLTCPTLFLMAPGAGANPLWVGYFELLDQPYSLSIPADGAQWYTICATYEPGGGGWIVEQADYDDNGDGVVSPGDEIFGPGDPGFLRDVITVASARRLYRLEETDWVLRPQLEFPMGPVGETWEVLYPDAQWGDIHIVDGWVDEAPPGPPGAGDRVLLDGTWYTIAQVSLCVEGTHAVPVQRTTWGKIKTFFGELF